MRGAFIIMAASIALLSPAALAAAPGPREPALSNCRGKDRTATQSSWPKVRKPANCTRRFILM